MYVSFYVNYSSIWIELFISSKSNFESHNGRNMQSVTQLHNKLHNRYSIICCLSQIKMSYFKWLWCHRGHTRMDNRFDSSFVTFLCLYLVHPCVYLCVASYHPPSTITTFVGWFWRFLNKDLAYEEPNESRRMHSHLTHTELMSVWEVWRRSMALANDSSINKTNNNQPVRSEPIIIRTICARVLWYQLAVIISNTHTPSQ